MWPKLATVAQPTSDLLPKLKNQTNMPAELENLFNAIKANYDGRKMAQIANMIQNESLPRKVKISESWEWSPGDTFGAKEQPDRLVLGRILIEGQPSAYFLCLSTDEEKRLGRLPYY